MPKKKTIIQAPPTKGFTTENFESLVVDTTVDQRLADQGLAASSGYAPEPSLAQGIEAAWENETATFAIFDYIGGKYHTPDPNFRIDGEEWKKLTAEVDPEYHGTLLSARSRGELEDKLRQINREKENRKKLYQMGGVGTALSMGAAVLDPAGILLSMAAAPLAGSAKVSRAANILRGAGAGAGANMALESSLYTLQETRDPEDILWAGGFGLGFGALGGYLSKHKLSDMNQKLADTVEAKRLQAIVDELGDEAPEPVKLRLQELTNPPPAKVKTVEEIKAELDARADAASDEVWQMIKAKGDEFDAKLAGSQAGRTTTAAADEDLTDWINALNNNQPRQVSALEEAWLRAKAKRYEKNAPKTQEEVLALMASRAAENAKTSRVSAFEEVEKQMMAQRAAEEDAAYLQRELQDAEKQDDVSEFLEEELKLPPKEQPETPPKDEPETPPKDTTPAFKERDDVVLEMPDGTVISGRIKSFNEDTGVMVVLDDATGKPKRVNVNEVDEASVADNAGVLEQQTSGFDPGGSVGSGQPAGTHVETGDPAMMYLKIPFTNFKVPLRFDFYSIFARSEVPMFRDLGNLLLSNSVGDAQHYGRGFNASEIAALEMNAQLGKYTPVVQEAYEEYAKTQGWNWLQMNSPSNRRKFNEMVTTALRDHSTSKYTHPQVGKVVVAIQEIHNDLLAKMKKYGVEGAEDVLPDPHYIMRRFNHDKISILMGRFDDAELHKLISGALRSVRPLSQEQADRIAKNYFNVVAGVPYADWGRMQMGEAGRARLRQLAADQNVDPDLVDEIVRIVLAKPDDAAEGSSPRLKNRTLMNEEFTMRLTGKDGKEYDVSMRDFFENDSEVLMQMYARQAGGLIGMAQMGLRTDADWSRKMAEAERQATRSRVDRARFLKEKQWMEDMRANILGAPMSGEVYGKKERLLKALRDWNFFRLMGQVGVAQVSEVMAGLATAGTRAMAMHMPAYREVIRMAKLGQIDDELGRDMAMMAGIGTEARAQQSLGRNLDDVFHDPALSRVEGILNEGRKAIAMVSGLAPVTNIMRQLTGRMFAQKMLDQARGVAKLDMHKLRRLSWMGIDENNIDGVFRDMKKYMKVDNETNGKLTEIDWESWQVANPDTYNTFRMALWRESRRVIQESTIGETAPWMHGTIGKVLTQFRGFMLVAHAKNTLNNLHHRDPEAAMVFMASMLGTTLAYIGQTSINYAGNDEKLDELLAIDKVALAGFQRTGFSALLPTLADTALGIAGHDPLFRHGRVSNQASSAIQGIATYDLAVNKLGGTAKNLIQNVTTDDYQATQKDISDAMSLLLPNVFGVRNLINSVSAEFPKYNTLREYNQQ